MVRRIDLCRPQPRRGRPPVNPPTSCLARSRMDREVLRRVGRLLRAASRPADLVARLGGDEFVLLLGAVGAVTAHNRALGQLGDECAGLSQAVRRRGSSRTRRRRQPV